MSDYERYGDYDDIEVDAPKSKNPVMLILKIITAVICISVIGILVFRMILFSNYPDSVSRLYFNERLSEYYHATDGNISAKTQDLRYPYDDPDLGNFFADKLIVVEGAEQLQIAVRYNTGSLDRLAKENGLESLDANSFELFDFSLNARYSKEREGYREDAKDEEKYDFVDVVYDDVSLPKNDSVVMYRYIKLVFDDVSFVPDEEGRNLVWIRLDIKVKGSTTDKVYSIPVYENNVDLDDFEEYKLKGDEKPQ